MTRPSASCPHPWLASVLLASSLLPLPLAACAGPPVRVDIYDRSGQRTLETYRHRGRDYVVGRPGNEYAVRIRNCTGRRVLAVVSVDGVNVITGETASPDQSGYVIEPYGYVNIEGWRKDLDRTAAFYFADAGDAFATRTGRPDNLGVIGVAAFRERKPVRMLDQAEVSPPAPTGAAREAAEDAAAQGGAAESKAAAMPALGTGHGRREWSPARQVEFERAGAHPDQRVVIRYDRRENLVAMGVLPRQAPRLRDPEPFPGTLGFVPDP